MEGTAEGIVVNDGATDGVRCNVISCAVLAVQWAIHCERWCCAVVLRNESEDGWAMSQMLGLDSMYRVRRGLHV